MIIPVMVVGLSAVISAVATMILCRFKQAE